MTYKGIRCLALLLGLGMTAVHAEEAPPAETEPTVVDGVQEAAAEKVQRQQDRVEGAVENRVDETTDRAVDKVLNRALDKVFGR